ncbi:MAG: hypothetical protein HZY75_07325 [Nocardioidaceae bacterium]|nr:MAG: hypothetical protein HZY75_07325 [Nocardioidaceae bacterium]
MDKDQDLAATGDLARARLLDVGAKDLPPRPWQHQSQPLADLDLVRYAAWIARMPDAEPGLVRAGISLLESARAELDQIEAALLFAARAAGMTYPELAAALGLRSAQAAQQRLSRVASRVESGAGA